MVRKIAILLPMFFLCLGLDNCKSPEGQSMLKHIYEYQYRYNVAVIYKRGEGDYQKTRDYDVLLTYWLYDPAKTKPPNYWPDYGTIEMNKIGENEYRCYLPKVFIQIPLLSHNKHLVIIMDFIKIGGMKDESVDIQGAYEQEIVSRNVLYDSIEIFVKFKMSNE